VVSAANSGATQPAGAVHPSAELPARLRRIALHQETAALLEARAQRADCPK
jgi:hypothetical protein